MRLVKIGFRLLWREWKSGSLSTLLLALLLAVATVSCISLFLDRFSHALSSNAAALLGADRVLHSSVPVADNVISFGDSLNLQQAQTVVFDSMLITGETMQLATVKAVSPLYPLRGRLGIANKPFAEVVTTDTIPAAGEVWLDSRLASILAVNIGDSIDMGATSLRYTAVLIREPGAGTGFAPRAMMNLTDIHKTELIQPGSRISYRYLFAGDGVVIDKFEQWLEPRLQAQQRLYSVGRSQRNISRALERAEAFLLLAGVISLLLCGAAIAASAKSFSEKHVYYVAVMKTLGVKPSDIDKIYLLNIIGLGLITAVFGVLLGWFIQSALANIINQLFPQLILPEPGMQPVLSSLFIGLVCLLIYAFPNLHQLKKIPPIIVLQQSVGEFFRKTQWINLAGTCCLFFLVWWHSGNIKLSGGLFLGLVVTAVLLWGVSLLVLKISLGIGANAGSEWRLAISSLRRRRQQNSFQLMIFSTITMLGLLVLIINNNLLPDWRAQLPESTHNHYLWNVDEDDKFEVEKLMNQYAIERDQWYPIVRLRLAAINGVDTLKSRESIQSIEQKGDDQSFENHVNAENKKPVKQAVVHRDYASTYTDLLPNENEIVKGLWWDGDELSESKARFVSVEEGIAERLGIVLHDKLTLTIAGETFTAIVKSIRRVNWRNMRSNFFLIFNAGTLEKYPLNYQTSLYLQKQDEEFLNRVARGFPGLVILSIDAVLRSVQNTIGQVSLALEFVLMLILLAVLVVLVTSIRAGVRERLYESSVLRSLGAKKKLLLRSQFIEFALLGFIAGVLGTLSAEIVSAFLMINVFDFELEFHYWAWVLGPLLSSLAIGVVGMSICRKVTSSSPMNVLRSQFN